MSFTWVWLGLAVLCNSLGNFALKRASESTAGKIRSILSLPFISGGALYALALLFYMRALGALPLSLAYPLFIGFSMVGTIGLAVCLLKEDLRARHIVGTALVVAGLAMLVLPHPIDLP